METITVAQGMMHALPGGWGGPPGPFVFLPFLFLFWALFLALLAWAALRLIPRWREGGRRPGGRRDSAEEILRERFARGETSAEEYERAMKVLREDEPLGYEDYVRGAEERSSPGHEAGS